MKNKLLKIINLYIFLILNIKFLYSFDFIILDKENYCYQVSGILSFDKFTIENNTLEFSPGNIKYLKIPENKVVFKNNTEYSINLPLESHFIIDGKKKYLFRGMKIVAIKENIDPVFFYQYNISKIEKYDDNPNQLIYIMLDTRTKKFNYPINKIPYDNNFPYIYSINFQGNIDLNDISYIIPIANIIRLRNGYIIYGVDDEIMSKFQDFKNKINIVFIGRISNENYITNHFYSFVKSDKVYDPYYFYNIENKNFLNHVQKFKKSVLINRLNHDFTNLNIKDIKLINPFIFSKKINLMSNNITDIQDLNLTYLEHIDLSFNKIELLIIPDNLKNLKSLILDNNRIYSIDNIKFLESLKILSLNKNEISNLNFLKNLNTLTELSLQRNKLTNIIDLSNLFLLNKLDLSFNFITQIQGIEKNSNLIILILKNNKISNIENLDNLINLEILDLSDNNITFLENIDNLKNLKILNLSGNKIKKINKIQNLTKLKELDLSFNNLDNIENLRYFKSLETLKLSYNNITNIRELRFLKNLKYLLLDNNNINNINILSNLENLIHLSIENNNIYEIKFLNKLKNLKEIYLNNNPIKIINSNTYNFLKEQKAKIFYEKNKWSYIEDYVTKNNIIIE